MMNKESICRNCFHSYVCEQYNENKDDNNTKCHFANDHYIPTADVVPRAMMAEIFANIDARIARYRKDQWYTLADMQRDIQMLKTKYTEGEK